MEEETEDYTTLVIDKLTERLETHNRNREEVQEAVEAEYRRLIEEIEERKTRFQEALEEKFTAEDERLQKLLNNLRTAHYAQPQGTSAKNALEAAVAGLLVKQAYSVDLPSMKLKTRKDFVPPLSIDGDDGKGKRRIAVSCDRGFTEGGVLNLDLKTPFTPQEKDVLSHNKLDVEVKYRVVISSEDETTEIDQMLLDEAGIRSSIKPNFLTPETSYSLKVRAECGSSWCSEWSTPAPLRTPDMAGYFSWRECVEKPGSYKRMYSVSPANPRVAKKINRFGDTTVLGNVAIPTTGETTWSVKLCAEGHSSIADGIYVGVAPYDTDQNRDKNETTCGWYLRCFDMKLFSGPPHYYKDKRYYKGIEKAPHLALGDEISVTFFAGIGAAGALMFRYKETLDGPAYENIPLDKPLVPAVLLYWASDSIEFVC